MRWKIERADDTDTDALTSAELVGLSVLAANADPPGVLDSVYIRAWRKIQPAVEIALDD